MGLDAQEAARLARLDVTIVWHYAEIGLIVPSEKEGYTEAELAELRRVRRLHDQLELDYAAIEIVLRMARRIRELSDELAGLRKTRAPRREAIDWVDAEWEDWP
jgi:DNA-binding transcriptional MerR regulator